MRTRRAILVLIVLVGLATLVLLLSPQARRYISLANVKENNKSHLIIPVEMVFENASAVNELLRREGITNVRIITREEWEEWMRGYLGNFTLHKINRSGV